MLNISIYSVEMIVYIHDWANVLNGDFVFNGLASN